MKFAFRSASSAALIIGIAGSLHSAWAQQNQTVTTAQLQPPPTAPAPSQAADQAGQPAEEGATDRVVITGSLIATAPEDAPKPVEVFTQEDLQNRGSPSISEFVRSLTMSAPSSLGFGQATPEVTTGAGFANADLRGLGSNATLVLMNGRRLASTNGGFGADINTLPVEALEAVEVLKDGASSTYGAGAVGGVINFRTRRDINAPQLTVEKQIYDGSDGAYKLDFLTGWAGDTSNLLLSMTYSHEDAMLMTEREFSSLPFNINPAGWTLSAANPGRFHSTTNFYTGAPTGAGSTVASASVPDLRPASAAADCTALGGAIGNVIQPGGVVGTAPNNGCVFPEYPFQDLVNENTTYRIFTELNADISDTMEVHVDATYNKSESFTNRIPIDPPLSTRAVDAGPTVGGITGCAASCFYVIPTQVGFGTYAANTLPTNLVRNPFIDDFIARTGTAVPATGALYTSSNWRPFLFGGTPYHDAGGLRRDKFQRERIMVNAGVNGQFTNEGIFGLLDGITYDYAVQYNLYTQTNITPDVIASRLQNALRGYGGPNCNAIDTVPTDYTNAATFNRTVGVQSNTAPGTGGCQWFNPFASAFATSIVNGAANPQFNSGTPVLGAGATARPTGFANPADLINWLYSTKLTETQNTSGTIDAVWTGQLPEAVQLPGGQIGWAAGLQWRMLERRDSTYDSDGQTNLETLNLQRCPWPDPGVVETPAQPAQQPGQLGCTTASSAFFGTGRANITLNTPPEFTDSQTIAYFAEVQLPVLDNLNFSASIRREDYNGGDIVGDIWSVAGKYDLTDNLYFRASYGTNFRAEAAVDLSPGSITFDTDATITTGRFGTGRIISRSTSIAPDIEVEDDKTFNAGVGWQSDLGEGRLRLSADFFEIRLNDVVTTTSTTQVYNNVFGLNTSADQIARGVANPLLAGGSQGSNPNQQKADCGARLISFLVFAAPCVTGVTTGADITEVKRFQLNGPGFITNGVDYSLDFSYPLFDGTFGVNLTATQNLVYKAKGYDVNGVLFTGDSQCQGVDSTNTACNFNPDWRANATVRWANDAHNVNVRANFTSGVYSEAFDSKTGFTPIIDNLAPLEDIYSPYGVFPKDYLDFDFNYIYTAPFWKELELRFTVLNMFDKNPMPQQNNSGYRNGLGNPRGRIIEIGATKKF